MAVSLPEVSAPAIVGRVSSVYVATLAAALVITPTITANLLKLDPGGAHRDVTLPSVTTFKGVSYRIINGADAAENLVVKNAGGDTIGTVSQDELADFYSDGTNWLLLAITTIALA